MRRFLSHQLLAFLAKHTNVEGTGRGASISPHVYPPWRHFAHTRSCWQYYWSEPGMAIGCRSADFPSLRELCTRRFDFADCVRSGARLLQCLESPTPICCELSEGEVLLSGVYHCDDRFMSLIVWAFLRSCRHR